MAYESFTLEQLKEKFALSIVQTKDDYAAVLPIPASQTLQTVLARGLPLLSGKTSEKARSEFVVAPVLLEVRDIVGEKIAVFSGIKFDVDRKAGLFGYCDFLVSRDPLIHSVQAPVVAIAEAKKEDLNAGIPQCVAEMVAAQRFNEQRKKALEKIYGVVTDGSRWQFLRLIGTTISIDLREYSIIELPQILGILVYMVS